MLLYDSPLFSSYSFNTFFSKRFKGSTRGPCPEHRNANVLSARLSNAHFDHQVRQYFDDTRDALNQRIKNTAGDIKQTTHQQLLLFLDESENDWKPMVLFLKTYYRNPII